jgi:SpoU rRNA methylase family enzyme
MLSQNNKNMRKIIIKIKRLTVSTALKKGKGKTVPTVSTIFTVLGKTVLVLKELLKAT